MPDKLNTLLDGCTNTSQNALIDKLRYELEKRDEEISKLKNLIDKSTSNTTSAKLREENDKDTVHCSTTNTINNGEIIVDKTNESATIIEKEILYHGTIEDDKPSKNEKESVVQIHYTITCLGSSSSLPSSSSPSPSSPSFVIEDSRERRNGQPFEFILGRNQITDPWEAIIRNMSRGEVLLVKMKLDSGYDYFLPVITSAGTGTGAETSSLASQLECNKCVFQCRIELLDFWAYEAPFRPWIINNDE